MTITVGLDYNNPLNLRQVPPPVGPWFGSIGKGHVNGQAVFPAGEGGLIACFCCACRNLYRLQHLPLSGNRAETLAAIAAVYAPTSDPNAHNEPAVYAHFLSGKLGVSVSAPIWFFRKDGSILDLDKLRTVFRAQCEFENFAGYQPIPSCLDSGIALYLRRLGQGTYVLAP